MFNDRGELRLVAGISGRDDGPAFVQPGVVAARLNRAKLSHDVGNVNVLTGGHLSDMGRGVTFYSVMVRMEKLG